jgi:hypothetical protein
MVTAISQWPSPAVGSPRQLSIEGRSQWRAPQSRSHRTAHEATVQLTWGVSLILTLLISLGLWASIWMVGSALVSAGLR